MDTILQTGLSNALVASVLALVAVLVGYFYRRPALVHGLWLLVLLKLVTPPLVPIPITWPAQAGPQPAANAPPAGEPSDTPLSADVVADTPQELDLAPRIVAVADPEPEQPESSPEPPPAPAAPATLTLFTWQTLVASVWLAGSIGWFLLAGWRVWCFRRLLHFAAPAPESLCKMAQRLARKMDLRNCPAVVLVPGRVAPMLWVIGGQPRLLVPRELLAYLTREQQETLLAHELAHLRRRDHWVRGLEFLAMGLYWWHPVVWYARRALREAEEQCCDAWVVSQLPGAGKTYATALLETLDFLSDARPVTPLLASGVGQVSDLKRRLTMIMCASTPRALSWRGTLAVLTLGLFALPLLPIVARAQAPEKPVEIQVEGLRLWLDKGPEGPQAQAELQKARAELAKLQQAVQATQARIKALEAQLAAPKGVQGVEKPNERILVLRVEGNKGVTEIHLRQVGDKWEVVQPPAKRPEQKDMRFEFKDGNFQIVPAGPMGPMPPQGEFRLVVPQPGQPPMPPMAKPVVPGTEGRIENLERALKQIMGELESLRREMKQPGKTGAPQYYTPVPKPGAEELKRSLPPGAKIIQEKDGIRVIVVPAETDATKKPVGPIEIEPKR